VTYLTKSQLTARLEEIFETFPEVTVVVKQFPTPDGLRYVVEVR